MDTPDTEVIDLDALVLPVARVKLFNKTHDVLPVDGNGANMLEQIAEVARDKGSGVGASLEIARRIAKRSVPTLTDEEVGKLSVDQITALMQLVTRHIDTVKASIARAEGNARGLTLVTASSEPSPDQPSSTPPAPASSA